MSLAREGIADQLKQASFLEGLHAAHRAAGRRAPATSTLNYAPGQTRANNATLSLGPAGDLAVFCGQVTGSAHLILDISGYLE